MSEYLLLEKRECRVRYLTVPLKLCLIKKKKKIIVSFYKSDVWLSAAETMEETGKIKHI